MTDSTEDENKKDTLGQQADEKITLDDLPVTEENDDSGLKEKVLGLFAALIAFINRLLDLKGFEHVVPDGVLERLPENRRLVTLPILILFIGFSIVFLLALFSPTASKKEVSKFVPVVRVIEANKSNIKIPVYTQGVVNPKNEIKLISLVNGPVISVSENFADGGVVQKDELLVEVSDRTYQQDKARVEASLERAKSAQVAKRSELRVRGTLRTEAGKAQLREVNAAVKAAQADVARVDDLIENTKIKAPFSGIIRGGNVHIGQTISAGTPIASIFTTDAAIVRLPLSDRQLSLIDLPRVQLAQSDLEAVSEGSKKEFPKVNIIGEFGDRSFTWDAFLVRSAGGRNELNRLQYVIVEIPQPYADDPEQPLRPPMSPGFFVQAEIDGREFEDVIKLPRKALKSNQVVWGLDKEKRLVKYQAELLHRGKDFIYVSGGIEDGAQVVVSDLSVMAAGLEVNPVAAKDGPVDVPTQTIEPGELQETVKEIEPQAGKDKSGAEETKTTEAETTTTEAKEEKSP